MMRGLLALLLAAAAAAQDCTATIPWFDPLGWTPVVVEIPARSRPLTVTVHGGGQRGQQTFAADPARARRATLLLPPVGETWGRPSVSVSTDDPTTMVNTSEPDMPQAPFAVVGTPAAWDDRSAEALAARLPNTPGIDRSSGGSPHGRSNRITAAAIPDRWEAIPSWLVIVLARDADSALDGAQRTALRRWLAVGGRLIVEDETQAVAWSDGLIAPTILGRMPDRTPDGGIEGSRRPEGLDRLLGSERAGGFWFAAFAVVFVVIAGPLPIIIARRRGRPAMLLVLIPAIGFGACLLLLVMDLLAVGWGVRRAVWDLTLADAAAGEHVQWSGVAAFAGRAPGAEPGSLRWTVPERDEVRWSWVGGADERLDGDLMPARSEALRGCIRRHADRRRLVVRRDPDGLKVVNALGTGIRILRWRSPDGVWYIAEHVADGSEAPLQQGKAPPSLKPDTSRLPSGAMTALDAVLRRPGGWLARLDAPLHPVPGPDAVDSRPPEAWAMGVAP
ncbi:MAG: hypothetical protein RLZZ127_991 [Planctomycetota bacterium]|jgi:hypothetical protein